MYEIPVFLGLFSPVLFIANYENDTLTICTFLLCSSLIMVYMLWLRRKIFPSIGKEIDKDQTEMKQLLDGVNDHKWIGYVIIGIAVFFFILLYLGKNDLILKLNELFHIGIT